MPDKKNQNIKQLLNKTVATKYRSNRVQELKDNRLVVQSDLTNSSTINTPLKTINMKNNLINNRLLMRPNKQIIVEPQLKKKVLRKRPVKYIYKDRIVNNYIDSNPQINTDPYSNYGIYNDPYSNYYNHNHYSNSNSDGTNYYLNNTDPYQNNRFPYWKPLWQQFYDPYIRMYDMRVLVPITNNNLGVFDINKSNKSNIPNAENSKDLSSRLKTRSNSFIKYASFNEPIYNKPIFNEPIPSIVKKKDYNLASDSAYDKKIKDKIKDKIKENFFENFRLPSTYRHQNRIHRVNHIRGPSRAISNRYINNPTRLMRYSRPVVNKSHKESKYQSKHDNKHDNKYRHKKIINRTNNYYGGSGYGSGTPYYYIGPYGYFPFSNYYTYDYRNVLPFDLNSAILPIFNPSIDPIIGPSDAPILQSIKKTKEKPIKLDLDVNIKKTKEKFTQNIKDMIEDNIEYTIENFTPNEVPIPEGFQLITLRIIEVDEMPNDNAKYNLVFIFILIFVLGYLLTKTNTN